MNTDFDWRTEEEGGWDEPALGGRSAIRKWPRPKRWQLITLLVVLGTLVLLIFFMAKAQLATNTDRMKHDVLASHEILINAVGDRDVDRFVSMLSDDSVSWLQAQKDLLRYQAFLSRSPLGFDGPLIPAGTDEISPTQVILSTQLNRAEVVDRFLYDVLLTSGVTETIQLEQIFHYKLDGNSWLLTKFTDKEAFWGPWHRVVGASLTLAYSERDAELGARLAADLDALLTAICLDPAVECPYEFHLTVRMTQSATSLLRLQEGPISNQILSGYGPETIDLPAPTIVGHPVDNDGYVALSQGYASWLAAVMLTNYAVDVEQLDPVTLADQLSAWGLIPIPPGEQPVPFRMSIPFPADVPPPEQDIMMLCTNMNQIRLIQYQIADGEWINRSSRSYPGVSNPFFDQSTSTLSRLANYGGALYILQEPGPNGLIWRIYLWQDGSERLLSESNQSFGMWPPIIHPATNDPADNLLMYQVFPFDGSNLPNIWALAIPDCLEGSCQLEQLDNLLAWSPGGDHTLVVDFTPDDQLLLRLGDREGHPIQYLGHGNSPNWINNDTYTFVVQDARPDELNGVVGSEQALIKGHIITESSLDKDMFEPLLTSERLRLAIPELDRPDQIFIDRATTGKAFPGRWAIIAYNAINRIDSIAYVFRYDEESDEIKLIQSVQGQAIEYSAQIGVDGGEYGYLTYDGSSLHYLILDLGNDSVSEYGQTLPYDQSADGNWLLFVENNDLLIVSHEYNFEWHILHDIDSCHAAVWINRE